MTITQLHPDGRAPQASRPPAPRRWHPTRAGILNVWRYLDETFHFEGGRLLLRGPNGTGKSKALELLLPYLFDANLRPSRLSTFGGTERGMYWNLMGDGYPGTTRVGYVWLEFARANEAGGEQWFTCGARLQATKNSRGVQVTYFTTSLRVGVADGLGLLTHDGRPLPKADLAAAIGETGATFESATGDYRRTVRQTLFPELGDEQYDALIGSLLQLRRPKLSEHLDPTTLSELLSQALPPLDQQDVAEIAEGFEKLDRRREELARLDEEVRAAESLATRSRNHARRVLRSAAAAVISATSQMDQLARTAKASRQAHEETERDLARVESHQQRAADEDRQAEERITGLQDTDAYREGQQLDRLRQQTERAEKAAGDARTDAGNRAADAEEDDRAAAGARHAAEQAGEAYARARDEAARAAQRVGLTAAFEEATGVGDVDEARRLLRTSVEARERQVEAVRTALRAYDDAVEERGRAETRLETCRDQRHEAEGRLNEVEGERDAALTRLQEALESWARGCRELPVAERIDELVESAADEPTVLRLLAEAARRVGDTLARTETTLTTQRQEAVDEREGLDAERADLRERKVLVPDPPHTRTAERADLPGAPLWRLVDWRAEVEDHTQARVEAALEASGLLDAWVLPLGDVRVAGHDTFAEAALATPAPGDSLADVLAVEPEAAVSPEQVRALLAGVAYGETAGAADHPAAIGADGTWHLAAARGSWTKESAAFIGASARERARQRRIDELTARIAELDGRIAELDGELERVATRRATLDEEQRGRPSHEELRTASARVDQAAAGLAARRDAEEQAERERRTADDHVAAALRDLNLAASEHGLPTTQEALDQVDEALTTYRSRGDTCLDRLQLRTSTEASAREADSKAQRSANLAEEADSRSRELEGEAAGLRARLETVQESIGAEYQQILDQLAALRGRRGELRDELERLHQRQLDLTGRVGELASEMRSDEDKRAEAVTARDGAADRLRHLHDVGFADEARLDAVPGDLTGVQAVLELARRIAEELSSVPYEPRLVREAEARLSEARHETQQALGGRADLTLEPDGDAYSLVATMDGGRIGATALHATLRDELSASRERLTSDEQELFDRTLTGDTRRQVADRIRMAEDLKDSMNAQLQRVQTASRLRVKLDWEVDPELPPGMKEARALLLRDPATLSEADREALHAFFRGRIEEVRTAETAAGWEQRLLQILDYRAWHRFVVLMDKGDGSGWTPVTKRRHGALSGGEKAIALHLPLFAAAAAHYQACAQAPRLILLDEVFVGVDDTNRGQLLELLRAFDLDLVLTSDHEWCAYTELDGIAIHQLITGSDGDGDGAVTTVRFVWDGFRMTEADPDPPEPESTPPELDEGLFGSD